MPPPARATLPSSSSIEGPVMRWSDLPLNPSPRMLRQFAGLWIVFFGGLAAWRWFALGQPRAATVLAVLAVTIGPLGLLAPSVIRPIFVAWLALAFPIGWVVSRVILLALFGLVMRSEEH